MHAAEHIAGGDGGAAPNGPCWRHSEYALMHAASQGETMGGGSGGGGGGGGGGFGDGGGGEGEGGGVGEGDGGGG